MKKKRLLLCGLPLLCLGGVVFCGWNFYLEMVPRVSAELAYDQLRELAFRNTDVMLKKDNNVAAIDIRVREKPDFDTLLEQYPDITGWLWSPGSEIDYPVVQGQDNEYYLNHTADGARSIIGSIFMENKNQKEFQDDVTILYGHHIRGGQMFSSLSGYKKQAYYEKHPVMYLFTPGKNYRVDLFAGEVRAGQNGAFPIIFESEDKRERWLSKLLASSTFTSLVSLGDKERILALCTCSYEYDDARYVVYGVLSDMEEEKNES